MLNLFRINIMKQPKLKVSARKANRIDSDHTDRAAWGPEPTWPAGKILESDAQFKTRLGFAFNWYSYMSDGKQQKSWFLEYLNTYKFPSDVCERLSNLPAESFAPSGSLVRCAMRGAKIENLQRYIKEHVQKFEELYYYLVRRGEIKVKTIAIKKKDPRITKSITNISEILDVFTTKRKPFLCSADDILTLNDATKTVAKEVIKYFSPTINELEAVLNKSDEDLTEGYANFSRQQINKMHEFLSTMNSYEPDVEEDEPVNAIQKTRKPRRKKLKTAAMVLKKFKYRKTSSELPGIGSVKPESFLGQQQLIIYHEDKRILGVFYASDESGLTVSGSSIRGFDEEKSFSKTIRKPHEVIPKITTQGKIPVRHLIEGLTTQSRILRSSISESTILLRVF